MIKKLKCFLFGHRWNVLKQGPSHYNLIHLHSLADTYHECEKCGASRNWLHAKTLNTILNKELRKRKYEQYQT